MGLLALTRSVTINSGTTSMGAPTRPSSTRVDTQDAYPGACAVQMEIPFAIQSGKSSSLCLSLDGARDPYHSAQ